MRGILTVALFIGLTALCWGVYGPVLHQGQHGMGGEGPDGEFVVSMMRPFICVGLAYFGIAVLVPVVMLFTGGEAGRWSVTGTVWSLAAGAAGAIGALGIIMAFKHHGSPIYVMPLVFGCAPVVNTFFTMFMARTYREVGPIFLAGLILVVTGAVTVLIFKPPPPQAVQAAEHAPGDEGAEVPVHTASTDQELTAREVGLVTMWVIVTALCWGMYGPVLHKGQSAMAGSKLRPLMCVGMAYFLIAVLIPLALTPQFPEPGSWSNVGGMIWSLAAGSVGAIGALGIILAFNFGGKPIYVMPLVFGGAPVVNTFTTIIGRGTMAGASPLFFAGLIIVAVGAVTVLIFAPRPGKKPATKIEPATAGQPA